jgi:hypothetical protein
MLLRCALELDIPAAMTSTARRGAARPRPSHAWLLLATLLLLPGCVAIQDDDGMTPIPKSMPQETVAPPAAAVAPASEIVILDLHEEAGPDPSLVRIVGTIVNRSTHDVGRLNVRVEARDPQGRVLSRVIVASTSDLIAADGGTSAFEASLPRSSAIRNYHAEVMNP